MVESTLRSTDPLAYYVNNVADLDKQVVIAYQKDDQIRLKNLLSQAKYHYNIFICINHGWHAFLLCVPVSGPDPEKQLLDEMMPDADNNPLDIPDVNLCYRIELGFENMQLKMYKIYKEFTVFKDVKESINKSYYVGKYKGTSPYGLDLAALRAAPKRYRALLDDCVEFAKTFCIELLAYCHNWREIEEEVNARINKAAASGLSIETLARRVKSSALFGNTLLNSVVEGQDMTVNWNSQRGFSVLILAAIVFFIYPIIITFVVMKYFNTCT